MNKPFLEATARIAQALNDLRIQYMIVGSVAASFFGEPRSTRDVDIVISANENQLEHLMELLKEDWTGVSLEGALDALDEQSMFNIIERGSGIKVDFIFLKDLPYQRKGFSRRLKGEVLETDVFVQSPEDTILSKLDWSRKGQSERQYRDAVGVATVSWMDLDRPYLRQWAAHLDLTEMLEKALGEADEYRRAQRRPPPKQQSEEKSS